MFVIVVVPAAATTIRGGGGDFICFLVILRSYAFVVGDRKWNCAPTAINDAGLHLRKEDLLWKGLKRKEK